MKMEWNAVANFIKPELLMLPGLPELERLSGRRPEAIKEGLAVLAQENYIEWDSRTPPERAAIIECWKETTHLIKCHKQAHSSRGEQLIRATLITGSIIDWRQRHGQKT